MKLELENQDLLVLISELRNADRVRFITKLEQQLCGIILKEFLNTLMQKALAKKSISKISVDDKTLLVLKEVLTQMPSSGEYEFMLVCNLLGKIDKACLSIS